MISVSLEMIYTGKEEGGKKTMQGITFEHTNRQLTPTRTACTWSMLLVALHPTSYKVTIVFPEKWKTEKKKNKGTVNISIRDFKPKKTCYLLYKKEILTVYVRSLVKVSLKEQSNSPSAKIFVLCANPHSLTASDNIWPVWKQKIRTDHRNMAFMNWFLSSYDAYKNISRSGNPNPFITSQYSRQKNVTIFRITNGVPWRFPEWSIAITNILILYFTYFHWSACKITTIPNQCIIHQQPIRIRTAVQIYITFVEQAV